MADQISDEIRYVLLMLGLFFVAKYLQRFRLPGAVTCLGIGVAFGLGLGWFAHDPVIEIFAVLGISVLFLFAGMEIDFAEMRRDGRMLVGHVVVQTAVVFAVAAALMPALRLDLRPALLVALALLTPSAGFILDSLARLHVTDAERAWIKTRAIGTEIVALAILLFALQSDSVSKLGISLGAIAAMIVLLPIVFRMFASFVLPHAPGTEFAFLVVSALVCALATKKLGVYYLVGAFVVGVTEQRLRLKLPMLANERTLHAVELFAAFFIPFYFLKSGLGLEKGNFSREALVLGGVFLAVFLPLRIAQVAVYRRMAASQHLRAGARLGVSLLPTLVFTIVIAGILRDSFGAPPPLVGGLILYTLVNTIVPSFVLHTPPAEYETPGAHLWCPLDTESGSGVRKAP